MSTMLKVAGLLNVFTVALLPVSLSGPIQSPTTPFVPGPTDGTKIIASSDTVDSNGCALEPPVSGYAHWYDARDIDGDGVLDEESDTDPVAAWVDKGSAGKDLSQNTSGYRPVVETDCNGISGSRCVKFDGSDDVLYAATTSDWDFLTDTSGSYEFFSAHNLSTLAASTFAMIYNTSSASVLGSNGLHVNTNINGGPVSVYVQGDSGLNNLRATHNPGTHAGVFTLNGVSNTSRSVYWNGSLLLTDASVSNVSAGCPLMVGAGAVGSVCTAADANTTDPLNVHQILVYKTALSTSDRAEIVEWMGCLQNAEPKPSIDDNGCDAEPPVSGYSLWYDARDINGDGWFNSVDASAIDTWLPKGTVSGVRAESVRQTTSSNKPTLDDDCISTNGPWCVYFDGGDFLAGNTASSWDFWNGTSDITFVGLVAASSSGAGGTWAGAGVDAPGTSKGITLSHRSTGPTLGLYGSTASSNGYVQLNSYASPSTITDMLSVMYIFDRTGASEAYKYIDNTLQATDSTIIDGDGVAGALEIGRQYSSGIATFTGNLMQLLVYEHDFTSDDRSAMQTWLGCLRGD